MRSCFKPREAGSLVALAGAARTEGAKNIVGSSIGREIFLMTPILFGLCSPAREYLETDPSEATPQFVTVHRGCKRLRARCCPSSDKAFTAGKFF